ncbi:MarR family transcriptional regulator [Pontibacter sp. G13]|uniref:MarR family winged helix-turn-helix transcriptional regulator n=1 Tax=Pontibacter sp. G13 TaxID=3074898 RepID=UPI002889D66F|nr:MarR family transcriptional regulator [Pontibacter sp. G13]WNJ18358.1 MarR family transcriptional regulator [Pontibacter sp. G13]
MIEEQLKLSNQICFPMYAVSRLLTKTYKPYLEAIDLTYPQYLVMMVLWETDGIPVKEISAKLILESNTLTPLLKRLEQKGLLQRSRSQSDERTVIIQLTKAGQDLQTQAAHIPFQITSHLNTDNISLQQLLQVKEILNTWITQLTDPQSPPHTS